MQNHSKINLPQFRPHLVHLKPPAGSQWDRHGQRIGHQMESGRPRSNQRRFHPQANPVGWHNVSGQVPSMSQLLPDAVEMPPMEKSIYGHPITYNMQKQRRKFLQGQDFHQRKWHEKKQNFQTKRMRWTHPHVQHQRMYQQHLIHHQKFEKLQQQQKQEEEKKKKKPSEKLSREQRLLKLRGRSFTRNTFQPPQNWQGAAQLKPFIVPSGAKPKQVASAQLKRPQSSTTPLMVSKDRITKMWQKFLNHKKSVIITASDVAEELLMPQKDFAFQQAYQLLISNSQYFNQVSESEFECRSVREVEQHHLRLPYQNLYDSCVTPFSDAVLQQVGQLEDIDPDAHLRRDLTQQKTYAIDDEDSFEIDDSISVQAGPQGQLKLFVHIADATRLISSSDVFFKSAASRSSSVYMPNQNIPMLPKELGVDMMSLSSDKKNYVMTFEATLGKDGQLSEWDIYPSTIGPVEKITYDQFDQDIEKHQELLKAAKARLRQRMSRGANQNRSISPKIIVDQDNVSIKLRDFQSHSRTVVQEFMLVANEVAARFATQNQIPVPYRGTSSEWKPVSEEQKSVTTTNGKLDVKEFANRLLEKPKFGPAAKTSQIPLFHDGLGLESYTQSSSPLRRFTDLLVHYQLKQHLRGKKPLTWQSFSSDIAECDLKYKTIAQLQKSASTHYTMRYFQKNQDKIFDGVVLATEEGFGSSAVGFADIFLTESGYRLKVPLPEQKQYERGQEVKLRCIMASQQSVAFRFASEP